MEKKKKKKRRYIIHHNTRQSAPLRVRPLGAQQSDMSFSTWTPKTNLFTNLRGHLRASAKKQFASQWTKQTILLLPHHTHTVHTVGPYNPGGGESSASKHPRF